MACLVRKKDSRFWLAMWKVRCVDGNWKNVMRSTKVPIVPEPGSGVTASELLADAMRIANLYEKATKGGVATSHIRKVLSELTSVSYEVPSVEVWFNSQLEVMSKSKKAVTYRKYLDAVRHFLKFLGDRRALGLDEVSSVMMEEYFGLLSGKLRVATVKKNFGMVKSFFSKAVSLGVLSLNPCDAVGDIHGHEQKVELEVERRAFSLDELHRVLEVCDEEWRSMVLVSLYTGGQRLGDIACLRWEQVDFEKGIVTMRTRKVGRGLVIPLCESLRVLLSERRGLVDGEFVHPVARGHFERSGNKSTYLSNLFGRILYSAGLREHDPITAGKYYRARHGGKRGDRRVKNELSFHSLRYSATVFLHEAGVPPLLVQKIVGHASAKVHEGYAAFQLDSARDALGHLPEL